MTTGIWPRWRAPTATCASSPRANLDLVAAHYDDLLRLAGSLKFGHANASLLVGKLSASSRQNALAAALKEYGAIRRTIYAARYEEVLAHISPAHSENINFFGAIEVDIEGELAQLGPTGYRPLRIRDTLF